MSLSLVGLVTFMFFWRALRIEATNCTLPPCAGPLQNIFCQGSLLEMAWLHGGERFLTLELKYSALEILHRFEQFLTQNPGGQTNEIFNVFLNENFVNDSSLEVCYPPDYQEFPNSLEAIIDIEYRNFARALNDRWKKLCRRTRPVLQDRSSLIPVPHPFIVPGGSFQEYYYWDTYWIIKGLLFSEMFNTTRGILLNFKYLVDKLGYIPNSGRIYEASRSQPPFFTLMVWDYFQTTGAKDMEFLREIFPALRKELQFWVNNRSVTVRKGRATHQLFQYRPDMNCPRPEGYLADINDALKSNSSDFVYRSIAAACESGWDFSSRWFRDPKSAGLSKSLIATIDIIPVDLNAILCRAMTILRIFAEKLGEETATNELKDQRKKLLSAMNEVLFNSTNGVWFDYVLSTGQLRHEFYPSNLSPLWAECYEPTNDLHDRIEKYVIDNNLMTFAGGLPTSLFHSGQQWDFPNGWPPLVHLVIDGFSRTNHSGLSSLAFDLAEKWIAHNYWGFVVANGSMWEKYDVNSTSGLPGSGGEYTVQEGFGWTNGVVLDLLKTYSHRLFVKQKPNNSPQSEPHSSQLLFCLLVVPVGLGILLLFLYMLESHRHRRTMTVSGVNPNIPTVTGWISNLHSYY